MSIAHRFACLSDFHYGSAVAGVSEEVNNAALTTNLAALATFHASKPIDKLFVLGDLVTNEPEDLSAVKTQLDATGISYEVSYGNHDRMALTDWATLWGKSLDYSFSVGDFGFIVLRSGSPTGTDPWDFVTPPSATAIATEAAKYTNKTGVFVLTHVSMYDDLTSSIPDQDGVTAARAALKAIDNLRAVFVGHRHDYNYGYDGDGMKFYGDGKFGAVWDEDANKYPCFRVVEISDINVVTTYVVKTTDLSEINAETIFNNEPTVSRLGASSHTHDTARECCWRKGSS